jgi:hypothetical protein
MNVKLEIPAPSIQITSSKITLGSQSGYKFLFTYNVSNASWIEVKMDGANDITKADIKKYLTKATSNKDSYLLISSTNIKNNLKGKVKFEVIAHYGTKQSKVYKKEISLK